MNPIDHPDAYALIVAGARAPGEVRILEGDNESNWDDKEADGQEGASTTYKGRKLKTFKTKHDLVVDPINDVDEITQWEDFVVFLAAATAGEKPVAFDVWHPDLATQEITSATPRKWTVLRHDGFGGASAEVYWKEHHPPKPKPPAGTSGSKSKSSKDGRTYGDDKVDEAKAELESLLGGP
jgi:hypothetical protein